MIAELVVLAALNRPMRCLNALGYAGTAYTRYKAEIAQCVWRPCSIIKPS